MTGDEDVVIIGAPRSGTNMLRDVVVALPGFGTWPCDEINPIWRHGNRSHPSDMFTAEMARREVRRFIRSRFDRIRTDQGVRRVVEKTCANSLRVSFVRQVLPDAKYIWITRDGLDAAMSAVQRWHAPFDLRYTAAKARFVPPSDLPYYAARFMSSRLSRRTSTTQSGGWWGPRVEDAEQLLASRPLDEVATVQWRECVIASREGFAGIPDSQLLHVSYESFVNDPEAGLAQLTDFLGTTSTTPELATANVSPASVGKGRRSLSGEDRERLMRVGEPEFTRLGYAS